MKDFILHQGQLNRSMVRDWQINNLINMPQTHTVLCATAKNLQDCIAHRSIPISHSAPKFRRGKGFVKVILIQGETKVKNS